MTDAGWTSCQDLSPMLEFLRHSGGLSARRWRLFAVACCRRIAHLLADERSRRAVDAAERFADRAATDEELDAAFEEAFDVWAVFERKDTGPEPGGYAALAACDAAHPDESADDVADYAARASGRTGEREAQAALLRCVVGHPFQPAVFDPAWRTDAVLLLARDIYEERAFDRLPIIADALQDAGCEDAAVLDHCRRAGDHVRGCWVVDMILGRG